MLSDSEEENNKSATDADGKKDRFKQLKHVPAQSSESKKNATSKLWQRFDISAIEKRGEERANKEALDNFSQEESTKRTRLTTKEHESWTELMKKQKEELSQLKLLEKERKARDKLYAREDKKHINIAKTEQKEREELINAKNRLNDQLKLLGQEQELRLKLIKERQQEHALHQTSQLTASEQIQRTALETDQQREFSQIGSQLSHVKEEALRKAAELATDIERKKLAIQWAQQVDRDILLHVIKNLQNNNKEEDLKTLQDFVARWPNDPHTALQIAVRDNYTNVVNIILSNITDVELKKRYVQQHCICGLETTALHFAALFSKDGVGMMDLLIKHGADVTATDKYNGNALILCMVRLGGYFNEPVSFISASDINYIVDSMRFLLKQGVQIDNDLLQSINVAVTVLVQVNNQQADIDALRSSVKSLNDVIYRARGINALLTTTGKPLRP